MEGITDVIVTLMLNCLHINFSQRDLMMLRYIFLLFPVGILGPDKHILEHKSVVVSYPLV